MSQTTRKLVCKSVQPGYGVDSYAAGNKGDKPTGKSFFRQAFPPTTNEIEQEEEQANIEREAG
jgi:hypothetical protein